jgi:hypothetical protein
LSAGHKNRKETIMKKKYSLVYGVCEKNSRAKRRGLLAGFAVVLITAVFTTAGCNGGGSVTQIETAAQFNEIRNNLSGHYILAKDIDLSGFSNFEPIGSFVPVSQDPADAEIPDLSLAFTGVFDGNGHKISNVTISAPTGSGVGLFGCVAGADGVVKNLIVENVTVSGMMLVGGVIGYGAGEKAVEHITLQGTNTITGSRAMVGGIVGGGFCDISNCKAAANVIAGPGSSTIGILAGGMEDSSLISCSVTGGSISFGDESSGIGGLAGSAFLSPEIKDCTVSNVTITVGEGCIMVGGLVGYAGGDNSEPTIIEGCAVNAVISTPVSAERIGGIVGSGFYFAMHPEYRAEPSAFIVRNSSSSGSINGGCTDLVGKIAGYIYDNSTVEATCTSTMTGAPNNEGGTKDSDALSTLK